MNTSLCVWIKAGSRSAEVELAKMGRLASHQGHSLRSHYEVGGGRVWVYFLWCGCSKISLPFILDREVGYLYNIEIKVFWSAKIALKYAFNTQFWK